ncbi:lysosome-associated membrane glycoprotein 1 [Rhinophrynus dorsalis]
METKKKRTLRDSVCGMVLLVLFGAVSSVHFEVKNDKNNTCILADLSINFSVPYSVLDKQQLAAFVLPGNASVNVTASTCGVENGTGPLLAIQFGANHSLNILFTRNPSSYEVAKLSFSYNLSDTMLFPNSSQNGTKEVSSNNTAISATNNTVYRCINPHLISMGNVSATFYDMKIEAYLNQNNYSQKESLCKEDVTPTSAPTSPPTSAPTSAPPTPPITPDPPVVQYSVNGTSGPCIFAKMGLQLNISYSRKDGKDGQYVFNIESNGVTVGGNCSNTTALLSLSSNTTQLAFHFALNTTAKKFYLDSVHVNTTMPAEAKAPLFEADNSSLMYLQTTAHKSYKCIAKQTLQITSNFSINTYNLQVQAFDLEDFKFGPAIECSLDENGMLVPIVVGAALAGLVLIVLIAYLIGRKRSHAGYQTI